MVFAVLCDIVHLWLKSIGIHSIFCVFALLPQKTLKRKNAVIYSTAFVSKRHPQNGGGMLLETLMSDPDSVQKALPQQSERFLFFRGPASEGRRLGARLTIELYSRSGTLVTHLSAFLCGAGGAEFKTSNLGTMLATTSGIWCGKIGPKFSAQTQEGLCWTKAGEWREGNPVNNSVLATFGD